MLIVVTRFVDQTFTQRKWFIANANKKISWNFVLASNQCLLPACPSARLSAGPPFCPTARLPARPPSLSPAMLGSLTLCLTERRSARMQRTSASRPSGRSTSVGSSTQWSMSTCSGRSTAPLRPLVQHTILYPAFLTDSDRELELLLWNGAGKVNLPPATL